MINSLPALLLLILLNLFFIITRKRTSIPFILFSFLFSLLFFWWYRDYPFPLILSFSAVYLIFTIASLSDIKTQSISIVHVLSLLVSVGAAWYLLGLSVPASLLSASMGFLTLFIPCMVTKESQIGLGDAFIFGTISLLLEPFGVFAVLLIASISALGYAGIYWLRKKNKPKIPYLPFLEGALFLYLPLQPMVMGWIIS